MKRTAVFVTVALFATQAQAGCLTGAVVGGVAGHLAHHHTLAGAAIGCAVGHHMAVVKKKKIAAEKRDRQDARSKGLTANATRTP